MPDSGIMLKLCELLKINVNVQMKIRKIRLQNGIFVYKVGISFTKWDFHLQREILGLQTELSLYISPFKTSKDQKKCKNNTNVLN